MKSKKTLRRIKTIRKKEKAERKASKMLSVLAKCSRRAASWRLITGKYLLWKQTFLIIDEAIIV